MRERNSLTLLTGAGAITHPALIGMKIINTLPKAQVVIL